MNHCGVMPKKKRKIKCKRDTYEAFTLNTRFDDYRTKRAIDEYGAEDKVQVQSLELYEETLAPILKNEAKDVFILRITTFRKVLEFLVFCIQVDRHCRTPSRVHQYSWYTQQKLKDIIVEILYDLNYIPPKYYLSNNPDCRPERSGLSSMKMCTIM